MNTQQVEISRTEQGDLLIHPLPVDRGAELLKGAERSTRKPAVLRQLDQLVRVVPVFFDTHKALCRHYAAQANRLRMV